MLDVRVTLIGTRPLVMHNVRLADPLDEYTKKLKQLNGNRKKTDEVHEEIAKVEYLGGMYFHSETGPYVPGEWVFASLVRGARMTKQGQKIERGVILGDGGEINPLSYDGPRDPEQLVADANFRLVKPVRVGQSRVMRTRPCFRKWAVEVPLFVDTEQINLEDLVHVVNDAGRYAGIGDHRPMFGRYEAKVEAMQ